ncbi:DUF6081 family protein [Streptomyces sp. NPDC023838]|uniref:DUF6081 family protein n=1 Tax=Streptomyces sp. NPDC023838 TaxID=3154325 RepID=UPI0033C095D2
MPVETGAGRRPFARSRRIAVGVVAAATACTALTLTGGAQAADRGAAPGAEKVLFQDDFGAGFDAQQTWLLGKAHTPAGELAQGDGIVTSNADGITVVPTGRNPRTGRPAFAATTGQDATGFGGGTGDHLKWVAQPRESSKNGFEIPAAGSWSCTTDLSVKTEGTENHPFGKAVTDPQSDPRLASATVITVDHASHTVANFSVTNTEVHAIYERLPVENSTYASFHYSVPVAKRTPGQPVRLQVRYDEGGKRVTWLVNGKKVLSTDRIGTLAFDRKYLRIDHGGKPEQVRMSSVQCALGTGNLLDGGGGARDRDKAGLVRLEDTPGFYVDPAKGAPSPQKFHDDKSLESNRLWGQGVTLKVRDFKISTTG